MKGYFLSLILFVTSLFSNSIFVQYLKFPPITTTPFITIPGNNSNMDVLYNSYYYTTEESSFICWVNQQDSVYTLFLRQTTPDSDKNIVVFSDTGQIANPSIAFINSANVNNVRIAWQTLINDHWQILLREYLNDSLTTIVPLTDSLEDNINPVLNSAYIAWIQNGNLIYKNLDSINAKPIILDTLDCSNPKISKFSDDYPNIIYEKGPAGNTQIYEANYMYNYYSGSEWKFIKVSKSGNNINPAIDPDGISVVYQEFENGVWKIVESLVWLDTTDNLSYNCENPVIFAYPLITKISTYVTPFFIVYTSDSVKNNVQIFLKTEYYSDTTINLSNAEGNNYLPHISLFISQQDTPYIAIYWIHDQNGKKDIWRAYSKYYPDLSPVINRVLNLNNFALNQNYPNPFNPSTVISWQLAKTGIITLKVYDVLGNELTTLVNEYQNAGEHSVTFDIQKSIHHSLSSGVYFYQLRAGNNIITKKMLYLR